MPTKRGAREKPKPKAKPTKLQNLAARPRQGDELDDDEQLVDHSGVFRVASSLSQAQIGHGDDSTPRFPQDSLVIAAQRDGFRDDGPTLDDTVETNLVQDEATAAEKRQRLATLAARARQLKRS